MDEWMGGVLFSLEVGDGDGGGGIGSLGAGRGGVLDDVDVFGAVGAAVVHVTTPVVRGMALAVGTCAVGLCLPGGFAAGQPK